MKYKDVWPEVIGANENITSCYDESGKIISLNRAERAREYAVKQSNIMRGMFLLDVGIGPGSLSKIILSNSDPGMIAGFDVSSRMLRTALRNLSKFDGRVYAVRGVFNNLPFRDLSFDRVLASFSLRHAVDLEASIEEFHRVCKNNGLFAVVDVGKPDNRMVRAIMDVYIRYVMPIIAKISVIGKISGNPFRLFIPTYDNLRTNKSLKNSLAGVFGKVTLKEFMLGRIVVMIAEKFIYK